MEPKITELTIENDDIFTLLAPNDLLLYQGVKLLDNELLVDINKSESLNSYNSEEQQINL